MDTVKAILFAVLAFLMYFKSETRFIVLLDVQGDPKELLTMDNIEEILKVQKDMGEHMHQGTPKNAWNYVLLTGKQNADEGVETYENYLKKLKFLKDFKVEAFDNKAQSQALRLLTHMFIYAKGLFANYVTGETIEQIDTAVGEYDKFFTDFSTDFCNEDALANTEKDFIVNLLRYTPPDGSVEFAIYEKAALYNIFPIIGTRIPMSGFPTNYWDRFALVEYSRQGYCHLVCSVLMQEKVENKRRGLEDSITLLTQRANLS